MLAVASTRMVTSGLPDGGGSGNPAGDLVRQSQTDDFSGAHAGRNCRATGVRSEDSGEDHWFRSVAAPLRDHDRAVVGVAGVLTDVTDLRRAHERLQLLARRAGAVYTRYGDDLTFSWASEERMPGGFTGAVEDALGSAGYEVHLVNLTHANAWKAPLAKMRSPYEFLVAAGRLLAQIPNEPGRYLGGLNTLGQPLWAPAGPNGFPDTNAAWAAPEGVKLRLDISAQIASRLADGVDPRDLLELIAADAASVETRRTIERAESRQQALALLLMSPEFQRR